LSSPETTPTTDPADAQQRGLFFFFFHRSPLRSLLFPFLSILRCERVGFEENASHRSTTSLRSRECANVTVSFEEDGVSIATNYWGGLSPRGRARRRRLFRSARDSYLAVGLRGCNLDMGRLRSRKASKPGCLGVAKSNNNTSGLSWRASLTASAPSDASPTTLKFASVSSRRLSPSRKMELASAITKHTCCRLLSILDWRHRRDERTFEGSPPFPTCLAASRHTV
jgi:hypothetical protein